MKKNVLAFVCALGAMIFTTELSAQEKPVSVRFKAGAGLLNYRLGGDMKGFKSKMGIGGTAGATVKYEVSSNFALQSGLDIYYNTSKLEAKNGGSSAKIKTLGLEIPLYAILQEEVGAGKAFIGAGAYLGYGIGAKADGVNLYEKNSGSLAMNRFDYGLGGIIGYDFDTNWQINAAYRFGLTDLHKAREGSMKNNGVTIGIAYKF
ncbi:opacity protein-like surface antigen [Flavobacterium sp. W4I14]|mgnify:CR=1 FL=1|nr:opacity protein-like surface antigen [Flavobacterium sp. W4I14]